MICQDCARSNFQSLEACPSCGGKLIAVPAKTKVNRTRFHARRKFCLACDNWGRHYRSEGWAEGCKALEKPCAVENLWLLPDANWCPESRDIQRPLNTGPELDLIAVTSLASHPHHLSRQTVCLESWDAFGLPIISVNTKEEIATLQVTYPQVDVWIESNDITKEYAKPTQRIKRLCQVAEEIERPILLMNSDLEIHGDRTLLADKLDPHSLIVGIRWNYDGVSHATMKRERFGLDAFVITPEMSKLLPDLPFSIGRPVWDYWLPLHFRKLGYRMQFVGDPLFFHETHHSTWTRQEWDMGASWITQHYDEKTIENTISFRKSLPYPPYTDPVHVLFHHVPKCAGQTVSRYLQESYEQDEVYQIDGHDVKEFKEIPQYVRHTKKLILGHHANDLTDFVHPDSKRITVLREPVDRVLSHYWYMRENPQMGWHQQAMSMTLEEMLEEGCPELCNCVVHGFGRTLGEAKTTLDSYDLIGFQDALPAFMDELRALLDLPSPWVSEVRNATVGKPSEIPPETAERIRTANELDCELYDWVKRKRPVTQGHPHHTLRAN